MAGAVPLHWRFSKGVWEGAALLETVWWFILGLVIGAAAMGPVTRLLLRRGEQRARDAERRARDAERLAELGSMTSGLAHEIKNPLSTLGLNAQLLSEAIRESALPDDERQRLLRRIDALRREADRLRDILTDFLQFAGRVQLDAQPVDLVRVVDEVCDFFLPQCERAGVVLRPQLPDGAIEARVDEGLFKQAMLNLLINAVQAMAKNHDRQRAPHEVVGDLLVRLEADGDEARVHVIDTGPGVEPDRVEAIFRPYVSGRPGGSGLGLPISRRVIEEHGGRLEVRSEPGRGSDFIIHLPLDQTSSPI